MRWIFIICCGLLAAGRARAQDTNPAAWGAPPPGGPVPLPAPEIPTGEVYALTFEETIALQTLLDRQGLSCNCNDGALGPRTRAALETWQRDRNLPPSGEPDDRTLAALGFPTNVFSEYAVTSNDHARLTVVPSSWTAKARQTTLGYQTIQEMLGERFHVSQGALARLNPELDWPNPPAGSIIRAPDPAAARTTNKASRVVISLRRKLIQALDANGRVLGQFPCSIARVAAKRPVGELHVVAVAEMPNYTFDPALFAEDAESADIARKRIIPPGPNNPVGVAWISLDRPGYGMHGTPVPEDIGKTESHGCFRLANWNADRLVHLIRIGLPVFVEP